MYKEDRNFTDMVHRKIAIPKIYKPLGWQEVDFENIEFLDIHKGIDRIFKTQDGKLITVQERFRIKKYQHYDDFTIRFSRQFNSKKERRKSEFFKIKADYFVYGITNCEYKSINNCSDFIKFAVISYKVVQDMVDDGIIVVDKTYNGKTSKIENGKIVLPLKKNKDNSSEFVPLRINHLEEISKNYPRYKNVVLLKKGF